MTTCLKAEFVKGTCLSKLVFCQVKPRQYIIQMQEESKGRMERVIMLLILQGLGAEVRRDHMEMEMVH